MDIISRVKNILVDPKNEWVTIEAERLPSTQLLTSYLLLLALIPAVGQFIGLGLIGKASLLGIRTVGISFGLKGAITSYITMVGGVYLTALVINMLATSFGSEKNFDQAFALVVYAYTPMCIGGLFYIVPSLSILASLAGLYGLYILYIGLQPMMKTPADKTVVYFIISIVCLFVVWIVLGSILAIIMAAIFVTGAMSLFG
jgi:hypothetical protein